MTPPPPQKFMIIAKTILLTTASAICKLGSVEKVDTNIFLWATIQCRPDPKPEQTQTKPYVCSQCLLLKTLCLLCIHLGFTLRLLRVCFWGLLYTWKCKTDPYFILPPVYTQPLVYSKYKCTNKSVIFQ